METFRLFWLRFRRAYDSAYDSEFWFSLSHKRSYDSDSDSVASENQPNSFFFSLNAEKTKNISTHKNLEQHGNKL